MVKVRIRKVLPRKLVGKKAQVAFSLILIIITISTIIIIPIIITMISMAHVKFWPILAILSKNCALLGVF